MGGKGRQVVEQELGIRCVGGIRSHRSLVAQLCDGMCRSIEGCSEDWILGRSFTYHYRDLQLRRTFIKVLGLML